MPWAVPSWGHAGAHRYGSEDLASNFQPKFIHGSFKPIIPVPMLCSSPAVLRPPGYSFLQCARRESACPLQLPGDAGLHGDLLRRTAGFVPEGLSPAPLPSPLPCAPSRVVSPDACPGVRGVPSLSPEPPRGDMLHPLVPIAMATGACCPPPHRVALNKGANEIKRSNQA